eukprot:12932649-Prorocentrum_lima.AAC.1
MMLLTYSLGPLLILNVVSSQLAMVEPSVEVHVLPHTWHLLVGSSSSIAWMVDPAIQIVIPRFDDPSRDFLVGPVHS